jgi:hypothetical protein
MNPNGPKITWPQLIAEYVIYWRTKFLNDYKDVKMGDGWSSSCSKAVRDLNQQASVLANYFPHPDSDPLVKVAFKNFFRNRKPLKIGQYRKVRVTKNGKQNITQDEKDVIKGIATELERLIKQRDMFVATSPKVLERKEQESVNFGSKSSSPKKVSLAEIAKLEESIKSKA